MTLRFQFASWLAGLAVCASLALPCAAQKNRPAPPPPHAAAHADRPPQKAQQKGGGQQKANPNRPAVGARGNAGNANGQRPNQTARQQLGVGAPGGFVQRMRAMPPAQREKFFQNSPAFHNLPPEKQARIRQQFDRWDHMTPAQRQDQVQKEDNWHSLSPEQKNHIRNDVLPAWKQMSPERQNAIQHRLQVLQNMPESARNDRLNDPKFTEGMSDEDKATLRDLSHMHIGGAPDPPE
jgi:hypothetical protein